MVLRWVAAWVGAGLMLLNAVAWVDLMRYLDLLLDGLWLVGFLTLNACLGWLLGRTLVQRIFPSSYRRSSPKGIWLGFVLLIGVAVAFQHPILASVDDYLLLNEPPQTAEVIWVLGISSERYAHAVDLFGQGYGKRLVMSLETYQAPLLFRSDTVQTNIDAILAYARQHGVPAQAMTFLQAENTYQEALQARDYFKDNHIQSALIVSSPAHMRRAAMIFNRVVGNGVKLTFNAVPLPQSDFKTDWWRDRFSLGRVIYEYLSLVYYYVAYVMF